MAAGYAHPEVLVDVDWIAEHLDDPKVRLVEVDVSPAAYKEGHIPGAVLWNAYSDLRGPGYVPVTDEQIGDLFSRSRISPETTVVFYGYGGVLGFWLMKMYGHRDARLVDGNRDAWVKAGHEWSTAEPEIGRSSYPPLKRDRDHVATQDEISKKNGKTLADVRSRAEYVGENFWPSGAPYETGHAGRIPGAVHVPVEAVRAEDGTYAGVDSLLRVFEEKGITPDQSIITYCTIGNRASQAWFVMKYLLGYPEVRVYYGSWVEWGMLPEEMIETG